MSQIFLSVLKFCACLCLLTMLGGVAHAQTCSVQYKGSPGSVQVGDGTLSWTTTYCNGYCQYGGYTQWNYAVTFSIGGAYVTGGGAQYIQYGSSGCSGGPGSGGYPLVLHAPTAGTITVTPAAGSPGYQFSPAYLGYINPKFVVVGVIYVPPGPLSFVSYLNSTTLGKSTSLKTSFSDTSSYSVSVSGTAGLSIPGIFGFTDHYTGTFSREFTNETDNSLQNALTSENSFASTLYGPTDPMQPTNHDYDLILLWLNPLSNFTIYADNTKNIVWTGYAFDADDQNVAEMDVFPVMAGWMNGHIPIPSYALSYLQRGWASSNQTWGAGDTAALTLADYAQICQADPYCLSSNYTVVPGPDGTTSLDQRFTLAGSQAVAYLQAAPGGPVFNQTYQLTTTQTQTAGHGGQTQYKTTYGTENNITASFLSKLNTDVKTLHTLTTTDEWSTTNSKANVTSATANITGPACNDVNNACSPPYQGPGEFAVYQDNVYNTFLLSPLGLPGAQFVIQQNGGPYVSSVTAKAGDTITYHWGSVNGVSYTANDVITPYGADGCGNVSGPMTIFQSSQGAAGPYSLISCQSGYTYTMTYTATDRTGKQAQSTITIKVN